MPRRQAERLREAALRHPAAAQGVSYPGWYFRRWHFLPGGYLSGRSVRLYERVIRPLYWAGSEARAVRLITRWLERTGARRVLELAPGPGRLLAELSWRLPGVEFRAVELSPYFVAAARDRARGAHVLHGDARQLEGLAGVFDAVIAAHYVGHLPPGVRGGAFAAATLAARPGGSIVTVEHRWHRWPVPPGVRRMAVRGAGFSRVTFYRREIEEEQQG